MSPSMPDMNQARTQCNCQHPHSNSNLRCKCHKKSRSSWCRQHWLRLLEKTGRNCSCRNCCQHNSSNLRLKHPLWRNDRRDSIRGFRCAKNHKVHCSRLQLRIGRLGSIRMKSQKCSSSNLSWLHLLSRNCRLGIHQSTHRFHCVHWCIPLVARRQWRIAQHCSFHMNILKGMLCKMQRLHPL